MICSLLTVVRTPRPRCHNCLVVHILCSWTSTAASKVALGISLHEGPWISSEHLHLFFFGHFWMTGGRPFVNLHLYAERHSFLGSRRYSVFESSPAALNYAVIRAHGFSIWLLCLTFFSHVSGSSSKSGSCFGLGMSSDAVSGTIGLSSTTITWILRCSSGSKICIWQLWTPHD